MQCVILHILFLSRMILMKTPGLWRRRRGHKRQKELVQPSEPCWRFLWTSMEAAPWKTAEGIFKANVVAAIQFQYLLNLCFLLRDYV